MLVSGGYCQHTEGFGEMAQGAEPLAKLAGAEMKIPFLLLLLSRSANPSYEARTRIPPAPPVAT